MEPHAPTDVRSLWRAANAKKRGQGKENSKRAILLAAMADPEYADLLRQMTETAATPLDITRRYSWNTKHEMLAIYGTHYVEIKVLLFGIPSSI